MGLFLARSGDQIKTLAAQADTQASGLLFRLLFTAAAHGSCGKATTGQRQQAQSSVDRDGGAVGSNVIVTIWVAHCLVFRLSTALSHTYRGTLKS